LATPQHLLKQMLKRAKL